MEKHNHKQQLREARRKNGQTNLRKKPRLKRISPQEFSDLNEYDEMAFDNFEPILPRGTHERRKQIEKQAQGITLHTGHENTTRSYPEPPHEKEKILEGLVIEAGSAMCRVDIDGEVWLCDLRGALKNPDSGYVNTIAVGDHVHVRNTSPGQGVIERIQPRRSVLTRPYSPDVGKTSDLRQIVVANLDQLLIIASWREPYIWPALIDRYLIAAQQNGIQAIVCINKIDLVVVPAEFEEVANTYRTLGYPLILSSVISKNGIQEIKKLLENKTTALAGLSGVGKSSILNAIQPKLKLKVGVVSDRGLFTGQGKHTTTQASLWRLDNGGVVIDTPGVRSFGVSDIEASELASLYPEMIPFVEKCRFSNCTHRDEPDCGVINAVGTGLISPLRYKNYQQILDEIGNV